MRLACELSGAGGTGCGLLIASTFTLPSVLCFGGDAKGKRPAVQGTWGAGGPRPLPGGREGPGGVDPARSVLPNGNWRTDMSLSPDRLLSTAARFRRKHLPKAWPQPPQSPAQQRERQLLSKRP